MSAERSWVYKNRSKPTKDSQFLESMTRVVFQAGLNWKMMDKKWPAFQEAFASFDVEKVASFEEEDIDRLLSNKSIVRNSQKIHATIKNAQEMLKIDEEYGSFRSYLDHIIREKGIEDTLKNLNKRFSRIGRSTGLMFLWSVGEEVPHP